MPEFSDAQLVIILQKSARRINRKLCLSGTDEQIVVNTVTGDITPDDEDLKDLVLLQAECLIAQRHFTDLLATDSASAGVVIKDGEQTIDTTSGMSAKVSLLNSEGPNSPCAELEDAIKSEKLKRVGDNGNMVW